MKKNFLKSLSLGLATLSLAASCSMISGKDGHKCAGNKCSSKKTEKNSCSSNGCASKTDKKESNKCASK
jgi:uncharacterized low-complexity protein